LTSVRGKLFSRLFTRSRALLPKLPHISLVIHADEPCSTTD
jgi:hypothetical protein